MAPQDTIKANHEEIELIMADCEPIHRALEMEQIMAEIERIYRERELERRMAERCAEYQELKRRVWEEEAAYIMDNFNMTLEDFLVAPAEHPAFQTPAYAAYWMMAGENGRKVYNQFLRLNEDYNIESERIEREN